jgi:hypothetical protein
MSKPIASASTRRRIDELASQAKNARRRYDLYKAKAYSSKPTSQEKLHELKRESEFAQMRLIRARADA